MRAAAREAAKQADRRASCSISTASKRSTMRLATPSATRCCRRYRERLRERGAAGPFIPDGRRRIRHARAGICEYRSGEARKQAEALMGLFDAPFVLDEAEYHVTISLGISFYPQDGESVDVLLKNADTAMYSAKAHRNEFSSYTPEMNMKAHDRLRLESDLRRAIEQEQFMLAYQPLVNLSSEKVVGVEALVRWHHPKRGLAAAGRIHSLDGRERTDLAAWRMGARRRLSAEQSLAGCRAAADDDVGQSVDAAVPAASAG